MYYVSKCRRTSKDPLLRLFLTTYGLNLLQVPREHASIGDLYAVRRDRVLPPGGVEDFLEPAPTLPRIRHEPMADVVGVVSDAVSLDAGLGLLEGFLAALGGGGLIGHLEARYRQSKAQRLRFRLEDARREAVGTTALGLALIGSRPKAGHPMGGTEFRHYLTVGVVRCSSITVRAEGTDGHAVHLELGVPLAARGSAAIDLRHAGEGEVRYRGSVRLAIGVELVELAFDRDGGSVRFKPQAGPIRIRGEPERALIGPPDGDAFIRIG